MENTAAVNRTSVNKKHGVFRFYPKSLITAVLILTLCFIEYKYYTTYVDEALAVVAFIILIASITKFTQRDIITFFIIIISVAIGLTGNIVYSINDSVFSILVDVLSQLKMPLAFFAMKYALSEKEKQQTIDMLAPIAKIYLVANAILAVISQIVSTPFATGERYGLKVFTSVFSFAHQYATVTFLMVGVIVCCSTLNKKQRSVYTVIGLIAALATFKSFSIMFTVIFIALFFYFKKFSRIDIKFMLPMVLVIVALSSYQINTYLVEESSPRRLFIDYCVVDANDHFPLGSGFGTFGSSEAAKHYSKLYYDYGFDYLWGMSPSNPSFLVDTYWPSVIGQLGWIGSAIFLLIYVRIFLTFGFATKDRTRRAFLYAMFAQYIIHAIGSAILQSSTGMLGFMALSLCTVVDAEKENAHNRIKLNVKT